MVALLLGTAACSSDIEPAMGGDTPVSFSVSLGDNIDSRTISDGTGANTLKFAVFENGAEVTGLAQTVAVANKQATINTKLVKGHTYTFVFWAQNSACTAYNTTNMSAITVDYAANCNDETRDAFYKMDSFTVTEAFEKTEVLTRPFAQINFLADDAAGVVNVNQYKSKVTVTGVPTTLNTLDGSVSGTTDVTFDYATIVNETLAGYESYKYVAMNYILAATDKEVKNEVALTVNDGTQDVNTVTVANCPVQRNYRTNIFGSLFTLEGKFNIVIDPIYNTPDNNLFVPYLNDADAITEAIMTPGAVVNVAPGMELNLDLRTIAEGVTINGNGSKLILNQTTNKVNSKGITLNGFTIDNIESGNASIVVNASGFSLKDCVFEPSAAHTFGVYLTNMSEDGVYNFDGLVYDATADRRLIVTECKGTVNISNSILKSIVYPISTLNIVSDCDINVSNTQLIGWTSFNTGSNHVYHFDNCYFGKLNYGYFRPYGGNGTNEIILNNCTFSDDYDGVNPTLGAIVKINNSAFESGTALTKDNIVDTESANGKVYIDGTLVYDSEAE